MTKPICGVVLPSDVGSDYSCTLKKGHGDDHCDARHPFSWERDVIELHMGLEVRRRSDVSARVNQIRADVTNHKGGTIWLRKTILWLCYQLAALKGD